MSPFKEKVLPGLSGMAVALGGVFAASEGYLSASVQSFLGRAVEPLTGYAVLGAAAGVAALAIVLFNLIELAFDKWSSSEPYIRTLYAYQWTILIIGGTAFGLSMAGVIGGSVVAATATALAIAAVALIVDRCVKELIKKITEKKVSSDSIL